MYLLLGLFAELIALFFLSKQLINELGFLFHRLTRSHTAMVYLLTILFFIGTVIHEISHYIMALVLQVPAGNITLWPKVEGSRIRLGSVSIAETNIVKRTLIGIAPLLIGTIFLFSLLYFCYSNKLTNNLWINVLLIYIIFTISNNMYSSRKDLEGLRLFLIFLLALILIIGYFFYKTHTRIPVQLLPFLQLADIFFVIPLCIDLFLIILMKLPRLK